MSRAKIFGLGSKYVTISFKIRNRVLIRFEEIFDDKFIGYLFDLVEQTRGMQDETLNYSVIRLIVSIRCDKSPGFVC